MIVIEKRSNPDFLNIAKVVALYKAGSKRELCNYTNIDDYLNSWKNINSLGIASLYLEKKPSTNHAVMYLYETLLHYKKNNNSVGGIFLNFAKAFHCVNCKILLNKLGLYDITVGEMR